MILRKPHRGASLYVLSSCLKTRKQYCRALATAATPTTYDVVVVGGGPAGLSLLTALRASKSTSHLKLALIESQDLTAARQWHLPADQYSNRASSLTPTSISYLSQTGVWDHIDQSRVQPFRRMRVWDGLSSTGRISFDSPAPGPAIAYMTENPNLVSALHARLGEMPPFDIFDKSSVSEIHRGPPSDDSQLTNLDLSTYPHVSLSTNHRLTARLLVGADGLNSPVRTFCGIPTRGWDYDRHGVVATLKLAPGTAENTTAYQRFLPTGPIALLALPNNHASLVWTTTPARAAHLKSLATEDFLAMVNAAFRLSMVDIDYLSTLPNSQASEFAWRSSVTASSPSTPAGDDIPPLAQSLQPTSLASFPLRLRHASTYIRPRTALLGDAAHTIHPLAGQGLNMGLSDSRALSDAITYAVEHGADIGDETGQGCLQRYNSEVWMRNNAMLGAVDKLHWLYGVRNPGVVGVRGVGLGVLDWVGERSGVKGWFMRRAGGL